MKLRRSPQTDRVLAEFLANREQWRYGYDISRNTSLKSGTLYPVLMRLADNGLLETAWENTVEGRPARHLYRLTQDGVRFARDQVKQPSRLRRLVEVES